MFEYKGFSCKPADKGCWLLTFPTGLKTKTRPLSKEELLKEIDDYLIKSVSDSEA